MAVPYTFGNATTSIPLSNLDTNFATAITLGNTAVYLGNTTTSFGNVTLTNLTISSVASTFPNSFLANSSVTINGSSVSLGGSVTITATSTGNLTIGTGLSGTSYNGSANVTIAIDSTVATLTGSQTLTNKTISGANNTLSNIGNGSLSNSSVTIGNTSVSLGGTATTLGNVTLTNVTISNVATTFPNSFLANSTSTLGNATITLGGTTTSVGNLTLTNATISSVSTPITVAQGGTGLVTITSNGLMTGNGTGNVTIISSGSSGNVLTSNGTAWLSTAPSAQVYPGAGIANSTGTAWGTSYTTNGTGTVVALITSPTFVTPTIGVASATSVNKVAITAPATSATLTLADGSTLATSGAFSTTLTATATTAVTLPTSGTLVNTAVTTLSSLTSIGTIATGVWNGTAIGIAYGGTGQATATAGFNALSPITTTGDLILGNGSNIATRLAIGANTYVLTSNGTTASWQAASGGGSGTVNSGTQYQLGYYATTGTAISGNSSIVTNSSGFLGIGTSSPAKVLNVVTSATTEVWVESTSTQKAILSAYAGDSGVGITSTYNTGGTAPRPFIFNSVSTPLLQFDAGKSLALQGASLQTGTGITFPATQLASTNANTLDDYEEGTWTPAFATWTTAPSGVVASYTKIGRQVTLNIVAFAGVCAAGSTITGIPFSASSSGPASVLCTTASNVVGFTALLFDSASQISNVSTTAMGGAYWTCSFTYQTN